MALAFLMLKKKKKIFNISKLMQIVVSNLRLIMHELYIDRTNTIYVHSILQFLYQIAT